MTQATLLDEDAPWTWSRRDVIGLLNQRQARYVDLVERVFRVKQANGNVVDYHMEPYQVWFHAHAPLAMGRDAPDRLVEKGRGLGLTTMTAMDLLLLAHASPRVKIPVAGRQGRTSDEFVDRCWDLMQDTHVDGFFDPNPELRSQVRLGNRAEIVPIPGGNPDSIRSMRAPASAYDEFAFHKQAERLWRAGKPVHSEGGQRTILSTHDGSGTLFYQLVQDAREGKGRIKLFSFPIHDPTAYDQRRSIVDQVRDRRLRLIAPWLDVYGLEDLRREDPMGYAQENLAQVMDDELMLLSRATVDAATQQDHPTWERPLMLEDAARPDDADLIMALVDRGVTIASRPRGNISPLSLGIDFASAGDLSAWVLYEGGHQRWVLVLRGVDTPLQNALLRAAQRELRLTSVLIDMTGPGTGLYEHAARDLRDCMVNGIHFGSSVEVANADRPVPIKKQLALTYARDITERAVTLVGEPHPLAGLQRRHLTAIRRSDLDAPRKSGEGHADIFWAGALSRWGSRVTLPPPSVVKPGHHATTDNARTSLGGYTPHSHAAAPRAQRKLPERTRI